MASLLRETPFGQIIRFAAKDRVLLYPEEELDFRVPETLRSSIQPKSSSNNDQEKSLEPEDLTHSTASNSDTERIPKERKSLVDWYSPTDPENPKNWSTLKKCFAFGQVCLCTFTGE